MSRDERATEDEAASDEESHYVAHDDCSDEWVPIGWFADPAAAWEAAGEEIGHDDHALYSLAEDGR